MDAPITIGVFDSGFGGLSVLREIRTALPAARLIYCADHAAMPYGEQAPTRLRARVHVVAAHLLAEGAEAIVIACNTATAAAAESLRETCPVPIIGMEPAVKPAARATRSGVVGILGTGVTLRSARFNALLARYAEGLEVVTQPAPELVVAAETASAAERRRLVRHAVAPLLEARADVIVLGCTHFPLLREEIAIACGDGVALIDTGTAVAKQLLRRLDRQVGGPQTHPAPGATEFWTTGTPAQLQERLDRLWGRGAILQAASLALPAAEAS